MVSFPTIAQRPGSRAGLTLLELLLVVLILSATALLAITGLESSQDQVRFEDTRARVERGRTAIVGEFTSTGVERSFVNDIGRLPVDLGELLEPMGLPSWQFDSVSGLWAGWRGPYLPVRRETQGLVTYRDGWGFPLDQQALPEQGWAWFRRDGGDETLFYIQSYGADGNPGGSGYAADFPPNDPLTGLPPPVVGPADFIVDLRGALVELVLVNDGVGAVITPAARLRCLVPADGSLTALVPWPATAGERDGSAFLSELLPATEVSAGGSATLLVRFLAEVEGAPAPKPTPVGQRGLKLVRDADGTPVGPPQPARPVRLAPRAAPPELSMTWKVSP